MISLAGCKIDRDKKVDRSKYTFTINDDAELFFRNVRQIYYDRSSPDGTWQAYRFSKRYQGNDRPSITPVIVINWLKDEAYLLIEENDLLAEEEYLQLRIISQNDTAVVELKERGRERMLEFGSQIYEAIQAKNSIYVLYKSDYVPIFTNEPEQEAFRITMSDFYRLTRVF
jgi:hypothetical protein